MRDFVILYVNGRRVELRGPHVFQSLSDFLRYDQRLPGTKVVCAEGDCGSCTVLLGRVGDTGQINYVAVTSCIQFMYQLDGTHVITVEGLKYDGEMNPVQDAMVRLHGTQCGYCTPGFVVAMCGMAERGQAFTEQTMMRGLVGNLCRCTGYEGIVRAGLEVDPAQIRRVSQLYPPEELATELQRADAEAVRVEVAGKIFFKPVTVAEAAKFRSDHPGCVLIAGGTDLGVQVNKGIREIDTVMALGAIAEMRSVQVRDGAIVAGAGATLGEVEAIARGCFPEFAKMLDRHGSPLIRGAGTLAGNIANGSPIGDSMPALYVLNGEIELTGTNGSRRVNINQFYTGYKRMVMTADELITRVFVPLQREGETLKLYKVSKRFDLDISSFTAAIWMRKSGDIIEEARLAFGGVAANILRLPKTEALLTGKAFSLGLAEEAGRLARSEIAPISDVRGSADYRLQLAENIFCRLYYELEESPLAGVSGNGEEH